LWIRNLLSANELLLFAYEDGHKRYYPKAIPTADLYFRLPKDIWIKKQELIINIYGFLPSSWEAKTTPKAEAFWRLNNKLQAVKWLTEK
ncbi:MAG: PIG-L family deacetylase, partial [Flavobacterium sp.]